jgi:hypothetical protein
LGVLAVVVVFCGAAPAWASGTTVYVAGTGAAAGPGANSGNCQSETSPCATVAYALTQGGTDATVAVAGTVLEDDITLSSGDPTIEQDPLDTAAAAQVQEGSGDQNPLFVVGGNADVAFRGLIFMDGNSLEQGGAIADTSSGTVTVSGDAFSYDVATSDGGAIWIDNVSGELDVVNSVFDYDSTGQNSTTLVYGNGGSIADDQAALVTIRGSTFDRNANGGDGGAVYIANTGTTQAVSILNSTFAENTAAGDLALTDNSSGNAIYAQSATLEIAGDVFDNTCEIGTSDTQGQPVDKGYNVAYDNSCLGTTATTDVASPAVRDVYPLPTNNISAQDTMRVGAAGPAAALIPADTSLPFSYWIGGPGDVQLCPVTDAGGVASSGSCNAGASQTVVPRPVVYLAGSGAANVGGANNTTSCGASASPCGLLEKAILSSQVNYPNYADPYIDVDGTVAESTSGITPTQPVTIQQDPGANATAAVIQGTGSNELLTIGYDGIEVKGLTFTGADPAIYDDDSSSTDSAAIDDVTFSGNGNAGAFQGGTVEMYGPSTLYITGSTFANNTANEGGSLFIGNGGTVHVASSSFSGDNATYGGAIAVGTAGSGTLYVDDSQFDNERATSRGGAIELAEGSGDVGTAYINSSIFANDSASDWGGAISEGIYSGDGHLHVADSIFGGDSAEAGGAIAVGVYGGSGSTPQAAIDDSVFGGDWATANGGAIDNGDLGGSGVLTVAGSSFVGDYSTGTSPIGSDVSGGAIDNGDPDGVAAEPSAGTLAVTGSTLYGDYLTPGSATGIGPAINEGTNGGDSATVAGDIFDGIAAGYAPPGGSTATPACSGSFTDAGYNAGTDSSCYAGSATGDQAHTAALDDQLTFSTPSVSRVGSVPAQLYSPIQLPEVKPLFSSALVGLIPNPTTAAGAALCPATDVLGVAGPYDAAAGCSAGALQEYVPVAPAANAYPANVTAASPDVGDATVSWTAPSEAAAGGEITGYTVTPFDVTTSASRSAVTTSGDSVSFSHLNGGDSYTFKVVTNNSVGSSGPATSNAVTIKAQSTTTTTPTTTTPTPTAPATSTPTTSTPTTSTSATTTPVTHTATVDNQRVKLTTPAVSGCLAPGKTWTVKLSSSAVPHSKRPKLKFVDAVLTLGGKHAQTVHQPSSSVRFNTTGFKKGAYTLKAVVSYHLMLAHGLTRRVTKVITARLSVC